MAKKPVKQNEAKNPVEANLEPLFTKEQILASKKYENRKDACTAVIPDGFHGTLQEVDILIDKFMKGKVK